MSKVYNVYVEMATLVRIPVESDSAESAEQDVQNMMDNGSLETLYGEEIGEQLHYGNFSHSLCSDLTEEESVLL